MTSHLLEYSRSYSSVAAVGSPSLGNRGQASSGSFPTNVTYWSTTQGNQGQLHHHGNSARNAQTLPATNIWGNQHPETIDSKSTSRVSSTKIFVGHVSCDVNPAELKNLFEEFGNVVKCDIKDKGYAFVQMGTPEAATNAIFYLNQRNLKGSRLAVKSWTNKPVRMPEDLDQAKRSILAHGQRSNVQTFEATNTGVNQHIESIDPEHASQVSNEITGKKIFVGNVTTVITSSQLQELFESYGRVIICDIVREKSEVFAGEKISIGQLSPVVTAAEFDELLSHYGNIITCDVNRDKASAHVGDKLIGYVTPSTSSAKLKELFLIHGNLIKCKVTDRAYGFVHMATVKEAKDAIQYLNQYNLNGSTLSLEPSKSRCFRTPELLSQAKQNRADQAEKKRTNQVDKKRVDQAKISVLTQNQGSFPVADTHTRQEINHTHENSVSNSDSTYIPKAQCNGGHNLSRNVPSYSTNVPYGSSPQGIHGQSQHHGNNASVSVPDPFRTPPQVTASFPQVTTSFPLRVTTSFSPQVTPSFPPQATASFPPQVNGVNFPMVDNYIQHSINPTQMNSVSFPVPDTYGLPQQSNWAHALPDSGRSRSGGRPTRDVSAAMSQITDRTIEANLLARAIQLTRSSLNRPDFTERTPDFQHNGHDQTRYPPNMNQSSPFLYNVSGADSQHLNGFIASSENTFMASEKPCIVPSKNTFLAPAFMSNDPCAQAPIDVMSRRSLCNLQSQQTSDHFLPEFNTSQNREYRLW